MLSGTNPVTRENKGIPNRIKFNINIVYPDGTCHIRGEDIMLSIDDKTIWWEHPMDQIQVDIGVIPLNDVISDMEPIKEYVVAFVATMAVSANDTGPYATFAYPSVASDVFILGFPHGLINQSALPIWKRGSVASEPFFDLHAGPIIYVDALTRAGMSGAPVICFGQDLFTIDGQAVGPSNVAWLVGVYAGRDGVTKEEADMALGRAWKRHLLDDIFTHRKPGPAS
jgi:hypothetical protein